MSQNRDVSVEALQRWKNRNVKTEISSETLCRQILLGDTLALSKAITWVESTHPKHREKAFSILKQLNVGVQRDTFRIGITGIPGVGKSTFIETFGNYLIQKGKRVAVLSVDPSSHKTGGSILGDKTRMHTLARNPNAFIRTSPSKSFLGGVTQNTYETIALCEAAGFDFVIVETVGVGQSEVHVEQLVDFFLLLQIPGAGDTLQAIKRGIMEIAHTILINKADGENLKAAQQTKSKIASLIRVFQDFDSGWHTRVSTFSAVTGAGMAQFYDTLEEYIKISRNHGAFYQNRKNQDINWMQHAAQLYYMQKMIHYDHFQEKIFEKKMQIKSGKIDTIAAIYELVGIVDHLV